MFHAFIDSFSFAHLTDIEATELKAFLIANRDLFAMKASEMGCTDVLKHRIELEDNTPFKEKFRPIPPGSYDEVRKHLAELLSVGVVQESKSPFSSNMVLVKKKDGSLRLCVDYRRLNAKTKKDAYSIPRVETLIDSLQGSRFFASLDLFAGYHQVEVADEHKECTAFSAGPLGFYEYVKMPFGLCNAPSTFQRMMEQVLEGLNMDICAVYLDDVIVYAPSKEDLYARLSEVFSRFRAAGLRLKPSKCKFFQTSVEFLGFVVSEEGTSCSTKHLEAVVEWPVPNNVKQLQTFLGFTNFYRKFIPGYASIAEPLYGLLRGQVNVGRGKKVSKSSKRRGLRSPPMDWKWEFAQQTAFEKLKSMLVSPPILAYPDFDKPFVFTWTPVGLVWVRFCIKSPRQISWKFLPMQANRCHQLKRITAHINWSF